MFGKNSNGSGGSGQDKKVDSASLQELAKSGEVQQLMAMLQKNGSVGEAAKSASGGNPNALLGMVQQLMSTEEGAALISNIQKKAKESGLE